MITALCRSFQGGLYLACAFGVPALYIWAVGILAAGQASTMACTHAGQFCLEGFLKVKWRRSLRVFVVRLVALVPPFLVACYSGLGALSRMNDVLNCLLSLTLPFALIPALALSSDEKVMGPFSNGFGMKVLVIEFQSPRRVDSICYRARVLQLIEESEAGRLRQNSTTETDTYSLDNCDCTPLIWSDCLIL